MALVKPGSRLYPVPEAAQNSRCLWTKAAAGVQSRETDGTLGFVSRERVMQTSDPKTEPADLPCVTGCNVSFSTNDYSSSRNN